MNAPFKSTEEGLMALVESVRRGSRPGARSGSPGRSEIRDPDHRHLRQGRHRQILHAGQSLTHDGAAGKKRVLLIGCDPKSDTTPLLSVGAPARPSIETSARKKAAGEEVEIGDVCFKSGGSVRHGARRTGSRPRAAADAGNHSGFEAASRNWASTNGALTTCCSTSWGGEKGATWCAAASACPDRPRTCARRFIVVAPTICSRSTSPTMSALRSTISASSAAMSAWRAWSSNKDDGTGEAAAFARSGRHPGACHDPGRRGHPRKSAKLPDHRHAGWPLGTALLPNWPRTSLLPAAAARHRSTRRTAWPVLQPDGRRQMSCSSRPPRQTCAAASSSRSRPSKIRLRSGFKAASDECPPRSQGHPSRRRNRKSSTTSAATAEARRCRHAASRAAAPAPRGNGQRRRGLPWRRPTKCGVASLDFQTRNDGAAQGRLPAGPATEPPQSMVPGPRDRCVWACA